MADGRVIGLVSGKGGVGKTTVCVNLGIALRQMGASVTVVDSDFSASNLGVHLGRYDHPVKLQKVLKGDAHPSSAIFRHPTGIKAMTASNEIDHVEPSTENLREVLGHAAEDSDYVLVDCPPGLNSTIESIMMACDEMLIVTTPTQTAGINAAQIIQKCKQLQKPVLGTVLNKVEDEPQKELVEREVEMMTESHIMGKVPHDGKVKESLFEYTPLMDYEPLSEASLEIKELAAKMSGAEYERPRFAKLKRKLNSLKKNFNS
jgi:MinD-like ATPase involved in chromosome partitioning or flagellar assembly